ncbi:putative Acyltransferase [Taphrina deformans PYCC 5710]|uniref:Acyltransferase n=1 Tax=Taphrina deformans (strain PYCC 5710 / ATCC 11124 / CBS 356.35 / IMI 108563 / JCM 9778 / NBRC 8474) TaxID=1097556 RepID=R4X826_TAPDE|nr:putative Acyltransferase [Taphrina deformans PYCC 5710]|eukprot:CCG81654.1 putative Acyltransferase [Taphrina deformans PYCC 5710]
MVQFSLGRHALPWMTLAASINSVLGRDINCACGYLDPVTKDLWTDTTILYFNETDAASLASNPDFVDLNFVNKYESGFDTTYRQGASIKNIEFEDFGALDLRVDPAQRDHLVMGGGIRTSRQDIQYGSFRAALRPAKSAADSGSSTLSMYYRFNASQSIQLDLIDAGSANLSTARFKADIPGGSVDATTFSFVDVADTAYDLNEWRFDWTPKSVNFSTVLNSTVNSSISRRKHHLPSVPGAVYFKHWSTGISKPSMGPPKAAMTASVGYIRIFYNSTVTSTRDAFGAQCAILQTASCSTEDYSLRVSSEFTTDSTLQWKLVSPKYKAPAWALYGVIITGTVLAILIIHAVVRRLIRHYSIPKADRPVHPGAYTYKLDRFALHGELTREMVKEKKKTEKAEKRASKRGEPMIKTKEIDPDAASLLSFATTNEMDQNSVRGFRSLASNKNSKIIASALPTMYYSRPGNSQGVSGVSTNSRGPARMQDIGRPDVDDEEEDENTSMLDSTPGTPRARSNSEASLEEEIEETYANLPTRPSEEVERDNDSVVAFRATGNNAPRERKKSLFQEVATPGRAFWKRLFRKAPATAEKGKAPVLHTKSRLDYLDGLRGLACFLVSLVHFSLTFYPGFLEPGVPGGDKYEWVKWIRITVNPIFFNANFGLGVFFILSSRLIGVRYLTTGHLQDLAGATFRRIPRLAFPVLCAVALEYFLMGVGAIEWLQYLASVTWSTWPYAVEFKNAGWFVNEYLALLFVQPPQLPNIIYNYCTGVLWTLPVSIQGSWTIFLGVIVIREIKTPWKRFGYYTFCMVNSWYALSWGSYFWVGLAISDLDSTYRYRTWGSATWRRRLIVLGLLLVFTLSMSSQFVQQVSQFSFPTLEYGIHSDLLTGLPINQTPRMGYPAFNLPQVYSLFAATAVILLLDFSYTLQKIFRVRILRALGYYSYSIYLLHGLIFWSWGSWLCVMLATKAVPYWANALVVFITSYIVLGISIYLWTPFADVFSGYAGTALWRRAQGRAFFATIG